MLAFAAGPAAAAVIEIGAGGTAVTYSGPVISTAAGTRPLVMASPARAAKPAVATAIETAAERHDLSPKLVEAVAWQESRLNQRAVSAKGARGLMQLMPATAKSLGANAHDLNSNADGGAAYLAAMLARFDGDLVRSLAAYNAGPEAVARYGGLPPYRETKHFVASVLGRLAADETSAEVHP
jgi:soluble lytic murein transglycosylase-like protein